jgi:hypothetical protein
MRCSVKIGKTILTVVAVSVLWLLADTAEAARQYTVPQTNPAPPGEVTMGTTQAITFTVTNTCTGGNNGERIYEMRFRINSGSLFNAVTAAPAGWTRTAYSTTSVTFRAAAWADAIPVGANLTFVLVLNIRTTGADVISERLRDARASFTTDNNFANGITNAGRVTINTPGQWNIRALSITSFQITDLAGVPITDIVAGTSFRVVMTIRNNSTATQTAIISNPNPPGTVETGTVTQGLTGTVYNPNPLTLAAAASGTITFTYSTNVNDGGTISFNAAARNNTGSATTIAGSSGVLAVGRFVAAITVAPGCQYDGSNVTVTMTLTNNWSYNIINVNPILAPSVGAPVAYVNGPNPGAPNGPVTATGGVFVFTWTYRINGGNPGDTFTFSGSAAGIGQTGGNPPRATPNTVSAPVTRGGFTPVVSPGNTNAGSFSEELTWSIPNQGCANVTQVSITIPAGWTLDGTDTYSLIDQFNPPNPGVNPIDPVENVWTVAGANPVVLSAPPNNVLPLTLPASAGVFSLVFSATPAAAGVSVFTVGIIDANGAAVNLPTNVIVDAFGTGGRNDVNTGVWREEIR